jgi:branched-subunit amino acid ABC-type transport system permease component
MNQHRTWYGAFSWHLLDPHAHPSYFDTAPGILTGDPANWELATLVAFGCCGVAAFYLVWRHLRRPGLLATLIATPAIIGAMGTIIQIHQAFIGASQEYIGPGIPFDEFIYYSLYSTHLGVYGTVILLVIFVPAYCIWGRSSSNQAMQLTPSRAAFTFHHD